MGATKKTAILTFVVQLMILGLVACLPALTIVIILLPIASGVFQGLIPNTIELSINFKTVLLSFAVAVLAGGLLSLPSLQKSKGLTLLIYSEKLQNLEVSQINGGLSHYCLHYLAFGV